MVDQATEFERETAYQIKDEDIERTRLLLGVDTATRMDGRIRTASLDSIRNFAFGYGDDNPLFVDADYGASTRWGSPYAPPLSLIAHNAPLLGDPLDPELKEQTRGRFRGVHVFVSGGDWTWYQPVFPGDTVHSFEGIVDVQVKQSEFAGRSVIVVKREVKINQRGEVVAVHSYPMIHTERKAAKEKGKYSSIEPATYDDDAIEKIDAAYEQERPRGSEPRYWEDVEVGEALPEMVKGPLTVTDVIVFHAGGYGFMEYGVSALRLGYKNRRRVPAFYIKNAQGVPDVSQRVHWESEWAQAIGNPMPYDYAFMRECWLQHFVTDWMGDDGWLYRQHDEMRKFNYIGDTQWITGEVVAKRQEDGNHLVEIEMRCTNQRGEVTSPATATVALSSREHGPVTLPKPPLELQRRATAMLRRHRELLRERQRG